MGVVGQLPNFKRGQIISGRWEGNRYKIIRHIGCGGSGSVYLVESESGVPMAVKISTDLFGLTCEYRVLVFLRCRQELKNLHIIPQVYGKDEFQIGSTVYHFIVMEYCRGKNLGQYKGRLSCSNTARVGRQIACFLDSLHRVGFVFGDLKPDNIICDFETGSIHVVDFGSVTIKGARVTQFTPRYDRASWQVGTRMADEHYDMFALGMLLASLVLGKVPRGRTGMTGELTPELTGIKNANMQKAVRMALTQQAACCEEIASCLLEIREDGKQSDRLNKFCSNPRIFNNFYRNGAGMAKKTSNGKRNQRGERLLPCWSGLRQQLKNIACWLRETGF